ncbi:hypothetical protein FQN60_018735 [Etheostoma spectabile]|uniref:Uncharacterized protein n=1 Tax=Etheostoma spectabile TaxID=54343 RepID=A0A5J5CDP6_9PERO|nr:hypothetical protein FQN60_018735 [Etheostoma spectabile]
MSLYHSRCETLNLQLIKPGSASTDAECGEPGLGFSSGAVIGLVVGLVMIEICLFIMLALFFLLCLKKKKDTVHVTVVQEDVEMILYVVIKWYHSFISTSERINVHLKKKKSCRGGAVVNKHRDSQPDTAEERSRFNEIQLDAGTLYVEQK